MLLKLTKSFLIIKVHPKMLTNASYSFCKLPKPSRFASELGLQKQFETTVETAEKHERSTTFVYNAIIGIAFCLFGGVLMTHLAKGEFRNQMRLRFKLYKSLVGLSNKEDDIELIKKTTEYLNKNYKHRIFDDSVSMQVISYWIRTYGNNNEKRTESKEKLTLEALEANLGNTQNEINGFEIYRQYFESAYLRGVQISEETGSKLITDLLKKGDLKTMYLACLIKNKNVVQYSISSKDKLKVLEKLKEESQKILQKENKIEEAAKNDVMVEHFEFDFKIRRMWIEYIKTNL